MPEKKGKELISYSITGFIQIIKDYWCTKSTACQFERFSVQQDIWGQKLTLHTQIF